MAINKFYKINQYNSSIHIYRGVLVIGDAYEMISEIKKGDAYFNFFSKWNKYNLTSLDFRTTCIVSKNFVKWPYNNYVAIHYGFKKYKN